MPSEAELQLEDREVYLSRRGNHYFLETTSPNVARYLAESERVAAELRARFPRYEGLRRLVFDDPWVTVGFGLGSLTVTDMRDFRYNTTYTYGDGVNMGSDIVQVQRRGLWLADQTEAMVAYLDMSRFNDPMMNARVANTQVGDRIFLLVEPHQIGNISQIYRINNHSLAERLRTQ